MNTPILLLPRELRDQIFIYALRSPSGFVILPDAHRDSASSCTAMEVVKIEPYDAVISRPLAPPNNRIKLSLLRACKQINEECNGLLWRHNALVLQRSDDQSCLLDRDTLALQLSVHLVHVQLEFYPFSPFERSLSYVTNALETFGKWSRTGALAHVDLRVSRTSMEKLLHLKLRAGRRDMYMVELLEAVRNAGTTGLPIHVKKRLILDQLPLGSDRRHSEIWQPPVDLEKLLHPRKVLFGLHNAFQGELWIDGNLVYKNGTRIRPLAEV